MSALSDRERERLEAAISAWPVSGAPIRDAMEAAWHSAREHYMVEAAGPQNLQCTASNDAVVHSDTQPAEGAPVLNGPSGSPTRCATGRSQEPPREPNRFEQRTWDPRSERPTDRELPDLIQMLREEGRPLTHKAAYMLERMGCREPERPIYEVERDRFGVMYSGPLEVGECQRVTPMDAVACRPAGIGHFVTTREWRPKLGPGQSLADAVTQAIADGILVVREPDDLLSRAAQGVREREATREKEAREEAEFWELSGRDGQVRSEGSAGLGSGVAASQPARHSDFEALGVKGSESYGA